jgi:hypothetical protein
VLSLDSTYRDALKLLDRYDSDERTLSSSDDISYQTTRKRGGSSNSVNSDNADEIETSRETTKTFVSSQVIPVVNSEKAMIIVGAVLRESVKQVLKTIRRTHRISSREAVVLGDLGDNESEEDFESQRPSGGSSCSTSPNFSNGIGATPLSKQSQKSSHRRNEDLIYDEVVHIDKYSSLLS